MLLSHIKWRFINRLIRLCFTTTVCFSDTQCRTLKICRDLGNIWSSCINRQSPLLYRRVQDSQVYDIEDERYGQSPIWYAFAQELQHVISFLVPYMHIYDMYIYQNYNDVQCRPYITKCILQQDKNATRINSSCSWGETALYLATKNNDVDVVRVLLEDIRIDRNIAREFDSMTPLIVACLFNHYRLLRLYINDNRVHVNMQNNQGYTALMTACICENLEAVNVLLQDPRVDINIRSGSGSTVTSADTLYKFPEKWAGYRIPPMRPTGWSAFIIAIVNKTTPVVKLLYDDPRTDLNSQCAGGWTALMHACRSNNFRVANLLLKGLRWREMNVNLQNTNGDTALMIACRRGMWNVVRLLVNDKRIDVNMKNANGLTAFMFVCILNHADMISTFLRKEFVNVNIQDDKGMTALLQVCTRRTRSRREFYRRYQYDSDICMTIQLLLGCERLDVNIQDNAGRTALHIAVGNGDTEGMKLLFMHKQLDINVMDLKGFSPLALASVYGNTDITKLLLDESARRKHSNREPIDVNQATPLGWTALMHASSQNRVGVVECLLQDPDVNVNVRNKQGYTALMIASECNMADIVCILLSDCRTDIHCVSNDGYTARDIARRNNFLILYDILQQCG